VEIKSVGPFLQYFANIRGRTMRLSRCVPADKVDWSYAPGKFTIGDLLRHIAVTERYLFAENIQGQASRYTSHGPELADTLEAIFALMERLHAESMDIFGQLTDNDLQRKCRNVGGVDIAIWKWLRAMTEHEIHHRGELYIYVGMLGVKTPPLYGLTSEEVRARSRAH
jgi:uncharacterized damage-inducible protein DinB